MIAGVIVAVAGVVAVETATPARYYCDYFECPQSYRVRKADFEGGTLNLAFLGDGFTEAQLGEYRCAVKVLSEALLTEPPFDRYACRTNVYRIDNFASTPGIPALCGAPDDLEDGDGPAIEALCASELAALGDPLFPFLACPTEARTFETRTCAQGVERLIWPNLSDDGGVDMESAALDLAEACTPTPTAVILIARTEGNFGGGDVAVDQKIGLAVVGLMDIENEKTRAHRLAHELGHALGLLDEYPGDGVSDVDYACGRNLFTLDPALASDPSCEKEPLWKTTCDPVVPGGTVGTCAACPAEFDCQKVCCWDTSRCPANDAPKVGLWEGAHYRSCGVFRSEYGCRMQDDGAPFCRVCNDVVSERLRCAGVVGCKPVIREYQDPTELLAHHGLPVRLKYCETKRPPRPTPPSGLDPGVTMNAPVEYPRPEPCPGAFRHVRAWTAEVEIDGIVGEVPIRNARMTIRPPRDSEAPFTLELEKVRDDGADTVRWRRSGEAVGKDAPVGVPDETGALVLGVLEGDVIVEDDVRGKRWKARSIRWD